MHHLIDFSDLFEYLDGIGFSEVGVNDIPLQANPVPQIEYSHLQAVVLHAVGQHTVYRITDSIPTGLLLSQASDILHPMPEGSKSTVLCSLNKSLQHLQRETDRDSLRETLHELLDLKLVKQDKARTSTFLTFEGVSSALSVRSLFTEQNVTSLWLDRYLTITSIQNVVNHLSRRCRKSVAFGEIMDLVNGYYTVLLARDGLRNRLAEGRHPSQADLRAWAYRSALSRFRDEGRDVLTREFKGARNEIEVRESKLRNEAESDEALSWCKDSDPLEAPVLPRAKPAYASPPSIGGGVFLAAGNDGSMDAVSSGSGMRGAAMLDAFGGDMGEEVTSAIYARERMAEIEAVVRAKRGLPGTDVDKTSRVFHLMCEGVNPGEIAQIEGLTRNRTSALINEAKEILRESIVPHDVARKILLYVQNEPFSMIEDLRSDLGDDLISPKVLDVLVARGKLIRGSKSHKTDQTFAVTQDGAVWLDNSSPGEFII